MAVPKNQPVQGGYAAILAFTAVFAAPVLAAPDRTVCDESTGPALEITATEFSTAADADDSIELLGPNFEFASRETAVGDDDEKEQAEATVKEDAETDAGNETVPADAGPLVHKRQMYRRDI
jgi:hypothetical protein